MKTRTLHIVWRWELIPCLRMKSKPSFHKHLKRSFPLGICMWVGPCVLCFKRNGPRLSDFHLPFPGSSAGIESTLNAGDPSSIPGSGRSPGEGIGYPRQYSWSSLVAQTVKNLPAMLETWFWSLGWEDPLEEGLATHSSILAWRILWTDEPSGLQFRMSWRVGHDWATKQP